MPNKLVIQSHKGPYSVSFEDGMPADSRSLLASQAHVLVDSNVARLHGQTLRAVLEHPWTQVVDATEETKSLAGIIPVVERLVADGTRRDHVLVAIGGGIVQDITCFIASTLLRGVPWKFVPTTLLAQADSCIGSKSSINLASTKNVLGTFNPPREVMICTGFLDTLERKDLRSGVGEILKVHAIESRTAFDELAANYHALFKDRAVLLRYIHNALAIKKRYIEEDEFDRGVRNVFNYGHSFGHAIESATHYDVPHGIAVTIGMDMANRISVLREELPDSEFRRMHPVLRENYEQFVKADIPLDAMLSALQKDKKNTSSKLVLILPQGQNSRVQRVEVAPDDAFRAQCAQFLRELRA